MRTAGNDGRGTGLRSRQARTGSPQQVLSLLLDQAYDAPAPEPAETFYAGLRCRLAAIDSRRDQVQALLMRFGLRLVPALAAMVIVVAGGAGLLLRQPASARGAAFDELVFFSDTKLSSNTIAGAIIPYGGKS